MERVHLQSSRVFVFWSLEVLQGLLSSTLFNFILGFEWENSELWAIMRNLAYADMLCEGAGSLRLAYVSLVVGESTEWDWRLWCGPKTRVYMGSVSFLSNQPAPEFSFHRAISMCKNTTQPMQQSQPCKSRFPHTSCNFQIKSHIDLHRPAGDTLLGERGWAWVPGKRGGFVFGYLVICVVFLLFLNIVK